VRAIGSCIAMDVGHCLEGKRNVGWVGVGDDGDKLVQVQVLIGK